MRHVRSFALPVVAILLMVLAFSGCTQRLLDFTVVSSKNTDMVVPTESKGERVEGTDSVPIILVPLGQPNLKEAIDRAIEAAGPEYDALIDGVLYYSYFYFIFGKAEYKVEGTPIKSSGINVSMGEGGIGDIASRGPVLYHSRTGKTNEKAVQDIGLTQIDR